LTVQQKWDMTNYWVQYRVTARSCGTKTAYYAAGTEHLLILVYYTILIILLPLLSLLFSPVRVVSCWLSTTYI